jgi:hypothetical protein
VAFAYVAKQNVLERVSGYSLSLCEAGIDTEIMCDSWGMAIEREVLVMYYLEAQLRSQQARPILEIGEAGHGSVRRECRMMKP